MSGNNNANSNLVLGFMKMRGEGGLKELGAGMTLIEKAASEGNTKATELLAKYGKADVAFVPIDY